jgi:zinc transport system substrate-binding protein
MNKKIIGVIIIIIILVIFAGAYLLNSRTKSSPVASKKIKVVASFYPLADFAKNVGGDLVDVVNITPAGAEPHDYEPTPQDIVKLHDANLVVLNGNGVDAWGEKITGELRQKGVTVVIMSDHLDSLKNNAPEGGEVGQYDPHFWLNPVNASKEADIIADALIKIDGVHEKEYNTNRDAFKAKLASLDQEYKNGLANCASRTIVTSHNAFNYLASQYNLTTLYVLGLSVDEEPSPKTIADTVDVARAKGITYIFFETLVSPKLSETIAREIGAKTLELNPVEGLTDEEIAQGKDYESVMKNNLTNLRIALSCQ